MKKNHFWVNFIVRAILGMGIIFFANEYLAHKEIAMQVGFNVVSLVTTGLLGLPGVALLYGVVALPIL